jgi:hypothetical protein
MGGLLSTLGGLIDECLERKEGTMRAASDARTRHDTLAEGGLPTKIRVLGSNGTKSSIRNPAIRAK